MRPLESRPSLVHQVYQALLDEICDGALPAGAHLIQEEIAAQLGVSRQPVQQAIALLKSDGLVADAAGRGVRVVALDLDEMRARYEVREALDRLAARRAAERAGGSTNIAAQISGDGAAIIAGGQAAVASGSVGELIRHDVDFHGFLYDGSGNALIRPAAEPHWRFLRRVMGEVLRHAEPPQEIWRQHQEILDAVIAGDADLAEARAGRHIQQAAAALERVPQFSASSAEEPSRRSARS